MSAQRTYVDIILAVGLCLPFDFNIFPVSHSFVFVCFPFAPAVVLCHNKVSSIPVSPIVVSHPSLFCLIWLFMFHPYYWPGLVMREACYFAQRDAGPCVPWAAAYARGSALGHVRRSCDVRGICRWCRSGWGGCEWRLDTFRLRPLLFMQIVKEGVSCWQLDGSLQTGKKYQRASEPGNTTSNLSASAQPVRLSPCAQIVFPIYWDWQAILKMSFKKKESQLWKMDDANLIQKWDKIMQTCSFAEFCVDE